MSNNDTTNKFYLSEYEAPISEEYNVVDSSSSAYSNQTTMDHVSTQAKENASGDTMPTLSSKDLNPTTHVELDSKKIFKRI